MNNDPEPNSSPDRPKRRPRYRGTHPRFFREKYKELNPGKYPGTIEKVTTSGKTPAGSHRPICLPEILELLAPKPGDLAVDATLGYGGHAREIVQRVLPGGRLIGLDVDPMELPKTEARLRALGIPEEALVVRRMNFAGLPRLLASLGLRGADCILADLGCSSMQLDNPARGFSFKEEGPLDLRMNPNHGRPAAAWLAEASEDELSRAFEEDADEPRARLIAQALVAARCRAPINSTSQLVRIIEDALKGGPRAGRDAQSKGAVQRVFQALRIEVNDEFSSLETFLRFLPDCLVPGGRVAILAFHSGEDRRAKKAFQEGFRAGIYAQVAREVIRPSPEEIRANPRSASAKLRWAIRSAP